MCMEPRVVLIPQPRSIRRLGRPGTRSDLIPKCVVNSETGQTQAYRLTIADGQVLIFASDQAGAFYAHQTLKQLRRQFPDALPSMTIEDWPDFPIRGVMIDISRDKVPTMATLFSLVDLLAELKINQLQLYTEHTFAYRGHEVVWRDASPMTAEEIRQLDAYCRDRFIELVPNQNSFGHLERWLKHPQYRHLAECPDGFTFPSGRRMHTGFSLNSTDLRSIQFLEELYDQLLPNFSSRLFNVGCDETFDLGLGRSREEVEKRGRGRVYLDFLLKIYQAVKSRGRRMMFWGDIILHESGLLGELPRDVIALDWGYEADHPFEKEARAFQDAGVSFYVCPGTSSWCSVSGRTDNALRNLQSAATSGLKHGACGYLITDWGDYGHLQYLPISYLGIAAGAAYAWCCQSNSELSLSDALDMHIFRDGAGVMGKLVHDLGNVYQAVKDQPANSSALFWTLINERVRSISAEEYAEAERRIDAAVSAVDGARMDRPDAELIRDEIRNAAAMLRQACRRGRGLDTSGEMRRIVAEHRRLWLARNRPGGLDDSVSWLTRTQRHFDKA